MNEVEKEADLHWYHRRQSSRYRLIRWLSKITKGKIRSPHFHSQVAFHKQNDQERVESSRIEPDEHVQIWSLWTVEFYTPDNINGLYDALGRLELAGAATVDQHPGDWLRQHRANFGSSMELNLARRGQQIWGSAYHCALPRFASCASCTILCVTPSLSVLVTHFEMNESERLWLDDELHRDHPTKVTQKQSGWLSISRPTLEQARVVREKREGWLDQATDWHRTTFPGLLSSSGEQIVACELSTLEGVVPLAREPERNNLLAALGLDSSPLVFEGPESTESKPFQLIFGSSHSDLPEMMFLTATKEQFYSQNVELFGNAEDGSYVASLDMDFRHTLAIAAVPRVLQFYALQAARARDGATAILGSKSASKALTRVRVNTAQCVDASVIARELRDAVKEYNLCFQGIDFTSRVDRDQQVPVKLSENIHAEINDQAQSLLADVEPLNATLHAQASLLSAHANLKLQPWIITLAVLSLLATVVAAIPSVNELLGLSEAKPAKVATKTKR